MLEDKILQIGKILNLSSTQTRGNTVTSLVESILYSYEEELSFKEIVDLIHYIFNIKPFEDEITESINHALISNEIISKQGKYSLSEEKKLDIYKNDLKNKHSHQDRFIRFKSLLKSVSILESDTDINKIWSVFNEYLYECFYQYGENAVNHFRASDYQNGYNNFVDSSPFRNALTKLDKEELRDAFKKVAILFIQNISHDDIEYLESLSQKTVAFHSLGLPKELHDDIVDLNLIDWTIYVDTNFLFSILKLHKHPENKACDDLLKLVQKENLNIKFRYTPFTMGELKQKRSDFETLIPKGNLGKSHISALLKSGNLDSYSEAYYEELLENSNATLHPTEIIDVADKTIQSVKKIGFHNSKFTTITDEYINEKVINYQNYISFINPLYVEKGLRPINKSQKQLFHDMFLREVIEYQQRINSADQPKTMSEVKFLGVTLDKLLIKYDRKVLSDQNTGFVIPNFHLPSFLLSKLYRLLPVQTDDYKKAFISAIATFSFSQSTDKSLAVQRFVNYYRKQGLEDEKLLLSFITDEFFLNKFFEEEEGQDKFFESEINKKFNQIQEKYAEAESNLEQLKTDHSETLEEKKIKEKLIVDQKSVIDQLKDSEKILVTEIKKINKKSEKEPNKNQLNLLDIIENNEIKKQYEELKKENERILSKQKDDDNLRRKSQRDNYSDSKVKRWRNSAWILLAISLAIFLLPIMYIMIICDWSTKDTTVYAKNIIETNIFASIMFGLFSLLLNVLVIRSLYDKYYNYSNIKAFSESIKYPDEMKNLP